MFFLWPLKSSVVNPKVKRVATRTLMCVIVILKKKPPVADVLVHAFSAATVALTTSMVKK
jgi:hypothetical protein